MKVKSEELKVKSYAGFTLVELLVVIALIGVLSTLLLANFNAARQRSRDAQRKSDVRNIQTALRLYYNDNGQYPPSDGTFRILGCGTKAAPALCTPPASGWGGNWSIDSGGTVYMTVMPKDPTGPDYQYSYDAVSDVYTLKSCLENKSDDKAVYDGNALWCPSKYLYTVKP